MSVKDISWNWIESELITESSLVNHTAMLCVSRELADEQLVSAFTKGYLWKRGGIAEPVPVLQLAQYVNPMAAPAGFMIGGGSSMSAHARRRQQVSGAGMYKQAASLIRKAVDHHSRVGTHAKL